MSGLREHDLRKRATCPHNHFVRCGTWVREPEACAACAWSPEGTEQPPYRHGKNGMIDMTGERFGRLTVIEGAGKRRSVSGKDKGYYWKCRCDCGNTVTVSGSNLRQGLTRSCGCIRSNRPPCS